MSAGALVVDTRPVDQRDRDGALPGAIVIDRNVLEWRLDPTCPYRLPVVGDPTRRIVIVCNEGYSSSLAAHTLQRLGLSRATDLVGGFQAWAAFQREASAAGVLQEHNGAAGRDAEHEPDCVVADAP
jgi:rhodanese-related sulfurtransferase